MTGPARTRRTRRTRRREGQGPRCDLALVGLAVVAWGPVTGCADVLAPSRASISRDGTTVLDVTLVGVARTAAERVAGLTAYDPLEPGTGLLLHFPVEGEVCLTGEPMTYPVDAITADATGLVGMVARLEPGDPTPVCVSPVKDVLELRAGEADAVRASDQLVWVSAEQARRHSRADPVAELTARRRP